MNFREEPLGLIADLGLLSFLSYITLADPSSRAQIYGISGCPKGEAGRDIIGGPKLLTPQVYRCVRGVNLVRRLHDLIIYFPAGIMIVGVSESELRPLSGSGWMEVTFKRGLRRIGADFHGRGSSLSAATQPSVFSQRVSIRIRVLEVSQLLPVLQMGLRTNSGEKI